MSKPTLVLMEHLKRRFETTAKILPKAISRKTRPFRRCKCSLKAGESDVLLAKIIPNIIIFLLCLAEIVLSIERLTATGNWTKFEFISVCKREIGKYRNSRSEMFSKIDVHKNFAIFTGEHLSWSLFLIKLLNRDFSKKRLQHRCFPVNIAKFLKTPFFTEHFQLLLLRIRKRLNEIISLWVFRETGFLLSKCVVQKPRELF